MKNDLKSLFRDAEIQMTELDFELKKPRIASKQISRSNFQTTSIENYYKLSNYIPLLDNIITDLKSRFLNEKYHAISTLPLLLPRFIIKSDTNNTDILLKIIKEHFTFEYSNIINALELKTELPLWKSSWIRKQNEGECIDYDDIKCISDCSKIIFPNIKKLLGIMTCLAISVASAERSFSTLRRLKTWLRLKMGQHRLCGLALLHIYQEINIPVDEIIERFSRIKNRKIDFVL